MDGSADDIGGVGGGGVDAADEELDCGDLGDPVVAERGRRGMGTLDCVGFEPIQKMSGYHLNNRDLVDVPDASNA